MSGAFLDVRQAMWVAVTSPEPSGRRASRSGLPKRLEGNYSASPLAADGKVYFQNEAGTGTVLQAGPTFAKLATNKLGERTFASYAVTGRSLLIRTERHLYRIGAAGQ